MKEFVLWLAVSLLGCASSPEVRQESSNRPAVTMEIREDGLVLFSVNREEAVLSCEGPMVENIRLEFELFGMEDGERDLYQLTHCLCHGRGHYSVRQTLSDEMTVVCER